MRGHTTKDLLFSCSQAGGAGEGGGGGHLDGKIGDGAAEFGAAGFEVGVREALGDEGKGVRGGRGLARPQGRWRRCRRGRRVGLRGGWGELAG